MQLEFLYFCQNTTWGSCVFSSYFDVPIWKWFWIYITILKGLFTWCFCIYHQVNLLGEKDCIIINLIQGYSSKINGEPISYNNKTLRATMVGKYNPPPFQDKRSLAALYFTPPLVLYFTILMFLQSFHFDNNLYNMSHSQIPVKNSYIFIRVWKGLNQLNYLFKFFNK